MDNNNMMNEGFETPVYEQPVYAEPEKKSNTKAILALVFGILSVLISCCCTYLGIALAIAAIILAVVSKKDNNGKMSGMAIAGMICGIFSIVLCVVSIALVLSGIVPTTFDYNFTY